MAGDRIRPTGCGDDPLLLFWLLPGIAETDRFCLFCQILHARVIQTNQAALMEDFRTNRSGELAFVGQIVGDRSEEHTSELQSRGHLVCRLLLEKEKTDSMI